VIGVAFTESIALTCDVDSNPTDLSFHWAFNHTTEAEPDADGNGDEDSRFREPEPALLSYVSNGTRSVLNYTPGPKREYGTVLCFANNAIGRQRNACVFHIIPADRPESVSNCTQIQRSPRSITVRCSPGFNGGLKQLFTLELRPWQTSKARKKAGGQEVSPLSDKGLMMRSNSVAVVDPLVDQDLKNQRDDVTAAANDDDDVTDKIVRNITAVDPVFVIENLDPGTRFEALIYSSRRRLRPKSQHPQGQERKEVGHISGLRKARNQEWNGINFFLCVAS